MASVRLESTRESLENLRVSGPTVVLRAELSESDLTNGELKFGLPAAMIVLVLVFATFHELVTTNLVQLLDTNLINPLTGKDNL